MAGGAKNDLSGMLDKFVPKPVYLFVSNAKSSSLELNRSSKLSILWSKRKKRMGTELIFVSITKAGPVDGVLSQPTYGS